MRAGPGVKPGTRCECATHKPYTHTHWPEPGDHKCPTDAVRMVTVPCGTAQPLSGRIVTDKPMCAACAEYHERRAT